MRHRKSGRKLNMTSAHRKAMFKNMTVSLLRHEEIRTTLPKAKELRRHAEPLITMAKTPQLPTGGWRSRVCAIVQRSANCLMIWVFIIKTVPGGYLRILKCGYRPGDKAPMAIVQMVSREKVDAEGDEAAE